MGLKIAGAMLALAGAALVAAPALTATKPAGGTVYPVVIHDMAYGTTPSVLHVGDVVEWVNDDIFRHSVTAKDKSFDVDLPPKARQRTVLKAAGSVSFYCRYHPGMAGRLTIVK